MAVPRVPVTVAVAPVATRVVLVCVTTPVACVAVGDAAEVIVAEGAAVGIGVSVAGGRSEGRGGRVGMGAEGRIGAELHAAIKTANAIVSALETNLFIESLSKINARK